MNLLMFNLAVDAEHVTLAFGLRWIEALAQRFEHIDLVTMYEGRHRLPANVRVWSVGRERGYPKWFRVLRFYWLTFAVLRQRRPAVVFSHMIPLFSVLFWPLAKLWSLPSVLWYAHGATPRMLRFAHRLVDRVVSSTPQGFRLASDKVDFIGQGIDAGLYPYRPRQRGDVLRLVTVGRLAPSKGQDRLVDALATWEHGKNVPWHLTVVGDATSAGERDFAATVRRMAANRLPSDRITFTGRLDAEAIAPLLATADLFINLGTTGSLDKAIVEAMASGCPVVSCNDAFRAIAEAEGFPDCVVGDSPAALPKILDEFANMSDEQCRQLGEMQSRVARRDHTLDGLIERLIGVLQKSAGAKP